VVRDAPLRSAPHHDDRREIAQSFVILWGPKGRHHNGRSAPQRTDAVRNPGPGTYIVSGAIMGAGLVDGLHWSFLQATGAAFAVGGAINVLLRLTKTD